MTVIDPTGVVPRWVVVAVILLGGALLIVAAVQTRTLVGELRRQRPERIWTVLLGLVVAFVVGYVGTAGILARTAGPVGGLHLLLAAIFFLGATFVLLVVRTSLQTVRHLQATSYSKNYLSAIFSSMEEPLAVVSTDGTVDRANRALLELLAEESADGVPEDGFPGPAENPIVGSRVETLFADEPLLSSASMATDIERLPYDGVETTLESSTGDEIPVLCSASELRRRSDLVGVVWTGRDITDQKTYQRELERQNARLDRFSSIVSHDLRNPLNVAAGNLAIASEEYDTERLATAKRALDRMETLVEELLTLARCGRELDAVDPVDLGSVARSCWEHVDTAEATLTVAVDGAIPADGDRVRRLLENLFRNAVEHAGNDVTVTVGTLVDGDGFYVADDGRGIPAADRETVFESGYSTAETGTGFGLDIVAEIADAHGWSVTATESADGGARFEFATEPDGR